MYTYLYKDCHTFTFIYVFITHIFSWFRCLLRSFLSVSDATATVKSWCENCVKVSHQFTDISQYRFFVCRETQCFVFSLFCATIMPLVNFCELFCKCWHVIEVKSGVWWMTVRRTVLCNDVYLFIIIIITINLLFVGCRYLLIIDL